MRGKTRKAPRRSPHSPSFLRTPISAGKVCPLNASYDGRRGLISPPAPPRPAVYSSAPGGHTVASSSARRGPSARARCSVQVHATHDELAGEVVAHIVPAEVIDLGVLHEPLPGPRAVVHLAAGLRRWKDQRLRARVGRLLSPSGEHSDHHAVDRHAQRLFGYGNVVLSGADNFRIPLLPRLPNLAPCAIMKDMNYRGCCQCR